MDDIGNECAKCRMTVEVAALALIQVLRLLVTVAEWSKAPDCELRSKITCSIPSIASNFSTRLDYKNIKKACSVREK